MNAKSKIFLALALVLSVTACSKGGGSHSSFKGGGGGGGTGTGTNGQPPPSPQNTYIAYKPDPPDNPNANVSLYVGKNVWFAPSGDYAKYVGGQGDKGTKENMKYWQQNMGTPQDYYYIQFGTTGTPIDISTNPGQPHYTVFKNKTGDATLGHRDPDIFLASPWMKAGVDHGSGTYHGPVVFQEKPGKIRHDLTMTLKIDKPQGYAGNGATVSGDIYDNNTTAAHLPAVTIDDMISGYEHSGDHKFESADQRYDFLGGKSFIWGYTDSEAKSISGIIGKPGNNNEFGAALLDKQSE